MQRRTLGNSNLEVSAVGLGCMGMSFGYGPAADKQEMVFPDSGGRRAWRHLLRHGGGLRAVRERRTRGRSPCAGARAGRDRHQFGFEFDSDGQQCGLNSRPEHIKEVVESSLERLEVDTIDLLYQ